MAQPPSFYGAPPRIAKLPEPIDVNRPLVEGVGDLSRGVSQASDRMAQVDDSVADYRLQTSNIQRQRELQRKTGSAAVGLATAYGQLQVDLANLRADSAPGADGHEAKVEERIAKFRDDFMGSLGNDPDLIERFSDNVAVQAATARTEETKWTIVERAKQSVSDGETLMGQISNNIATAVKGGEDLASTLANGVQLWQTYVASQPITGNARKDYDRKGKAAFASAALDARMLADPKSVMDAIDSGAFNASGLDAGDLRVIRDRADVLFRRAQNEAESAGKEAAATKRAEARVLVEQVGEGVEVKSEDLQAALTVAETHPTEPDSIALAHDIRVAIAKNAVTVEYGKSSNADRLAAQRDIEGKQDWQKDEQLVAAHDQLATLIGRDKTAAKEDPLGLYVRQTGADLPKASITDRDAMVRRFAIGDRVAQRYPGTPPTHLTKEEADQLRDEWKNGTAASRADIIQVIGSYGSQRGREIMRQLAPAKPELARLVEMAAGRDPNLRQITREAMDGWAQPQTKAVDNSAMQTELRGSFGNMMALMPGDRRDGIFQVATMIYKHRAAEANVTSYNRDLWNGAVRAALGEAGGTGGVARARSGEQFILPAGMTAGDVQGVMARSGPQEFRKAANGVPKWSNGRDLTEGEFKKLTPVLIRDDGTTARYAFRSGANTVKVEGGGDYVLDMRLLARNGRR